MAALTMASAVTSSVVSNAAARRTQPSARAQTTMWCRPAIRFGVPRGGYQVRMLKPLSAQFRGGCGPMGGQFYWGNMDPKIRSDLKELIKEFAKEMGPWGEVVKEGFSEDGSKSIPIDVEEVPEAYRIIADVPGVPSDAVKVQVSPDRVLTITAERTRLTPADEQSIKSDNSASRTERRMGKFQRKWKLPENADSNGITARTEAGVLTLNIMKVKPDDADVIDIPVFNN